MRNKRYIILLNKQFSVSKDKFPCRLQISHTFSPTPNNMPSATIAFPKKSSTYFVCLTNFKTQIKYSNYNPIPPLKCQSKYKHTQKNKKVMH